MPIDELSARIDAALSALSSDRSEVGLSVERSGGRARVSVGTLAVLFGGEDLDDTLAWELLVDALPGSVEHARLTAMHDAAGVQWAAPWSVHTTATALAWLTWASGGTGTPRWLHNVGLILAAADHDGSVAITSPGAASMSGVLRARRLLGLIKTGPRSHYLAAQGQLLSRDIIPNTAALASAGRDLSTLVDAPWLSGWDVRATETLVGETGTLFVLDEPSLPLEPIPPAAAAVAPLGGPPHAPWIVTDRERSALDRVDDAAHRGV